MKVIIKDGCISCGLCSNLCPQIFVLNDIAEVNPDADFEALADQIKDIAECCPVEVIKLIDNE